VIASLLGASEIECLTDKIEQRPTFVDLDVISRAVDGQV
jgi:hypothetical protein